MAAETTTECPLWNPSAAIVRPGRDRRWGHRLDPAAPRFGRWLPRAAAGAGPQHHQARQERKGENDPEADRHAVAPPWRHEVWNDPPMALAVLIFVPLPVIVLPWTTVPCEMPSARSPITRLE